MCFKMPEWKVVFSSKFAKLKVYFNTLVLYFLKY